jgi:hypothetical protein
VRSSFGLAGLALSASLLGGPAAEAQEFRHRGWVGARLPGDTANGCAMGLDVRRGGAFVVYANSDRAFRIGVASRELALEQGKEGLAAVTFDDSPPILLKGAAISTTTILFDAMDLAAEGGLQRLVEAARAVRFTYAGRSLRARLSGSARAIKLLRDCASAPEPIEAEPPAVASPQQADGRSVDFSFLRQGMDLADANARLIDAGWQAEQPRVAAGGDDPLAQGLRDGGVTAASCSGAPPSCVVDYADAYGNALRVAASGDGGRRIVSWRLNPPDAPEPGGGGEDGAETDHDDAPASGTAVSPTR